MKVIFAIPALTGALQMECAQSLMHVQRILDLKGIPHDLFSICDCACISRARNNLVADFMADKEATDFFFIDSDVGFDAKAVVELLERPDHVIAGIYPLKQDLAEFPIELKTEDGRLLGRDGLVEALFLPAGFMRIKREVFEILAKHYPELKYEKNFMGLKNGPTKEAYNFFGTGVFEGRFYPEDYFFCRLWREIGGQLWVYPDINFHHIGKKAYAGNYHEYLLGLPGGAKSNVSLTKALGTPGYMAPRELVWLATQAKQHKLIVEFGSFLGRSTRVLADNAVGKVYAMDDWRTGIKPHWGPEILENLTPDFEENLYLGFCLHLQEHIDSGKVVPVRANNERVDLLPPEWFNGHGGGQKPDMLFIDGDHHYEPVKRDIKNGLAMLRAGGLLCGHDYDWKTVRQAVDELLPTATVVPGTSIWFCFVQGEQHERIPEKASV
jgi:hypothetical protein